MISSFSNLFYSIQKEETGKPVYYLFLHAMISFKNKNNKTSQKKPYLAYLTNGLPYEAAARIYSSDRIKLRLFGVKPDETTNNLLLITDSDGVHIFEDHFSLEKKKCFADPFVSPRFKGLGNKHRLVTHVISDLITNHEDVIFEKMPSLI